MCGGGVLPFTIPAHTGNIQLEFKLEAFESYMVTSGPNNFHGFQLADVVGLSHKVTPKQMEILWFQYFRRIGLVYLLQSCRFIRVEFLQYHPSPLQTFSPFFRCSTFPCPNLTWVSNIGSSIQSSPGRNNKPTKTGKPIIYKPQCFVTKMVSSQAPSLMMRWKLTCTP